MPVSENKYQIFIYINRLFLCLRNILIVLIFMLTSTWSIGWVIKKYGYFKYYKFVPGQYTGYRLQQLEDLVPEDTCLILGASTSREAFNLEKLEEEFPDLDFITFATTGPYNSSSVIDIQASLIPKNKYACIIVGTHPFSIFTPDDPSYELESTNYFSQIPFLELIRMSRFDGTISTKELDLLSGIILVPTRRHSGILADHLLNLSLGFKSNFDGDLSDIQSSGFTKSHILYKDERSKQMQSFIEKRNKEIKLYDMENPLRYNSLNTNSTLTMALKRLDGLTERLIVLDLPETPIYEKVIKVSFTSFIRTLHSADPNIKFYQCEFMFLDPYDGFVDTIHVNSKGRQHLTEELIKILKRKSKNTLCKKTNIN